MNQDTTAPYHRASAAGEAAAPEIPRQAGVALWKQISQTIEGLISDGTYPAGSRLPTESQLAERFKVNRHTLRRAMASLQDQGLIRVEQGRGTFVQDDILSYPVNMRTRFTETVEKMGRNPQDRLLRSEQMPSDVEVARGLEIRTGELVLMIEIVHSIDQNPITVTSHYFPARRFQGLIERFEATRSLNDTLEHFGITSYFRKQSMISACLPNADIARHLNMPRTQPVVVAESVNVDQYGTPFEFSVSHCASQRMKFVFRPLEQVANRGLNK